jgi:hypothetical protein
MKKKLVLLFILTVSQIINAQQTNPNPEKFTAHNKGKFYIFWGGNREKFSKSDIRFTGQNYDFTLHNVIADDKPKGWHVDYINPGRMTIPQTNFRYRVFYLRPLQYFSRIRPYEICNATI